MDNFHQINIGMVAVAAILGMFVNMLEELMTIFAPPEPEVFLDKVYLLNGKVEHYQSTVYRRPNDKEELT